MLPSGRHPHSWTLFLLVIVGCAALADDRSEPTYRSSANEVRLDFSAADRSNHSVSALQASDFVVVDNDVIVRNFLSFTRADWNQLEIAILVDGSDSVRPRWHEEIASIFNVVSQSSGIARAHFSLFSMSNSQSVMVCAGDCLLSRVDERLSEPPGGLTPLYDGIVMASRFLAGRGGAGTKKILLIFSDGADTMSQHTLADAIDSSLQRDVEIDCVEMNEISDPGMAVLENLSRATGGHSFAIQEGVTNALNVILEHFRSSYIVTYHLPTDHSGFHSVHILPTHNLNLEFRSRNGYYYAGKVQ